MLKHKICGRTGIVCRLTGGPGELPGWFDAVSPGTGDRDFGEAIEHRIVFVRLAGKRVIGTVRAFVDRHDDRRIHRIALWPEPAADGSIRIRVKTLEGQ